MFAGQWNEGTAVFHGAWVSYRDADGETDIVVSFTGGPKRLILLAENKIDADFQPDQPERYRQRGMRWIELSRPPTDVETVLLAPAEYLDKERSDLFDRKISYEELIDSLTDASDPRSNFLGYMLTQGIQSHRRGYVPEHDETNTRVWQMFWDIASKETPRLRMRPRDTAPSGARFIVFDDAEGLSTPEIKRRAMVIYKGRISGRNHVDIQFGQTTEAALLAKVAGILEDDMSVVRAAASASIRVEVPTVDFSQLPEGQEDAIRAGIHTAERLRRFFAEHSLVNILEAG